MFNLNSSVVVVVLILTCLRLINGARNINYINGSTIDDIDFYLQEYLSGTPKLALLLDYDGTLANITSHPNTTTMPEYTREVLRSIANNEKIFVAVISGRGVDNVRDKVGIDNIVYSGNHGLEIYFPNGTRSNQNIPSEFEDRFDKMVEALNEAVAKENAWIENKRVSLTFHYRLAPVNLKPNMIEKASEIIRSFGYRVSHAHEALEAKPPLDWNKGSVAQLILESYFGNNWHEYIRTVFAGDDTTDEDIMKVLSKKGISFRVTSDPSLQSFATYKIPSTYSVYRILKCINDLYSQ